MNSWRDFLGPNTGYVSELYDRFLLAPYGITEDDLHQLSGSLIDSSVAQNAADAFETIQTFRAIDSSTMDYDYHHIPEERAWLRDATETRRFSPPQDSIDSAALLECLTQAETFEQFLHHLFPGKTRFSLDGSDMLVPILDELIGAAAEAGVRNILLGMAHRGRLSVLAHVLGKPYAQILAEFKDPARAQNSRADLGWTGDIKYHAGARRALKEQKSFDAIVRLPPNPSHLEAINPIVEGMAHVLINRVNHILMPLFHCPF